MQAQADDKRRIEWPGSLARLKAFVALAAVVLLPACQDTGNPPSNPQAGPALSPSPAQTAPGDPSRGGKVLFVTTGGGNYAEGTMEFVADLVSPGGEVIYQQGMGTFGDTAYEIRLAAGRYTIVVRKRLCDSGCEPGFVSEWWEYCQGELIVPDVPFDRFSRVGAIKVIAPRGYWDLKTETYQPDGCYFSPQAGLRGPGGEVPAQGEPPTGA